MSMMGMDGAPRGIPITGRYARPIGIAFFGLIATVLVLVAISKAHAAGRPGPHNGSNASSYVVAVVCLFGFAALAVIVTQLEHNHRHAIGDTVGGAALAAPTPAWRYNRSAHGPVSATVVAVFTSFILLVAIAGAFSDHAKAAQSSRTQSAALTTATVVFADPVSHHDRDHSWYTSNITVTLPTGGTSVVHDPQDYTPAKGQQLAIKVDPKDASYSELPGESPNRADLWIFAMVISVILVPVNVLTWRRARRMWSDRRS
jgi:hypothetical protein